MHHHFVIVPGQGVGPIRFGMPKDEVSPAFTYVYSSSFKTPSSKVRSDYCEVVGLAIHYDDEARVDEVEVAAKKAGVASVTWELFGRDITGISVQGLIEYLGGLGFEAERTGTPRKNHGYDFPGLGIATYNRDLKSNDDPVEWLLVSRNGLQSI